MALASRLVVSFGGRNGSCLNPRPCASTGGLLYRLGHLRTSTLGHCLAGLWSHLETCHQMLWPPRRIDESNENNQPLNSLHDACRPSFGEPRAGTTKTT